MHQELLLSRQDLHIYHRLFRRRWAAVRAMRTLGVRARQVVTVLALPSCSSAPPAPPPDATWRDNSQVGRVAPHKDRFRSSNSLIISLRPPVLKYSFTCSLEIRRKLRLEASSYTPVHSSARHESPQAHSGSDAAPAPLQGPAGNLLKHIRACMNKLEHT